MFDVPADAAYVWLGVATVSVVVLGVVASLPSATAPDATAAARTVDAVAAGSPGSRAVHSLDGERLRLGPHRIAIEGSGGTGHATFAFGPVTPVPDGGRLERVLEGTRVVDVFDSVAGFETAVVRARGRDPTWQPAPDRLLIRRVSWGDVRATLVG